MNEQQINWLKSTAEAARDAGHVFPEMAACEAALESSWGQSKLAVDGNNLFGMKQKKHPIYGTLQLPTREFVKTPEGGEFISTTADWVDYPDLKSCFLDRMETLKRLAPYYEHYARALMAPTPQIYIQQVSMTWSTDPERAEKVQQIYMTFVEATTPSGTMAGIDLAEET